MRERRRTMAKIIHLPTRGTIEAGTYARWCRDELAGAMGLSENPAGLTPDEAAIILGAGNMASGKRLTTEGTSRAAWEKVMTACFGLLNETEQT
jgi:sugar (pentulose or hexulose) kinase